MLLELEDGAGNIQRARVIESVNFVVVEFVVGSGRRDDDDDDFLNLLRLALAGTGGSGLLLRDAMDVVVGRVEEDGAETECEAKGREADVVEKVARVLARPRPIRDGQVPPDNHETVDGEEARGEAEPEDEGAGLVEIDLV